MTELSGRCHVRARANKGQQVTKEELEGMLDDYYDLSEGASKQNPYKREAGDLRIKIRGNLLIYRWFIKVCCQRRCADEEGTK